MKKKVTLIALMGLMLPSIIYGQDIKLIINNQVVKPQVAPIKENGLTLVPIKVIATELGATVNFNAQKQWVTVVKGNKTIELPLGKKEARVNGTKYELSAPAKVVNGTTMVPIRFIADHLDCSIEWEVESGTIVVTSDGGKQEIENTGKPHKNIYTSEYLEELVTTTPCSPEVLSFRAKDNPRRKGLLKMEGKYFDLYYPANDTYAEEVAQSLKPHMDKVYMMLTDLYGIQAKVEVHLIDGKIGQSEMSLEGEIRSKENVTFVWLEKDGNDFFTENQNITELIHEMNHNFFDQANGKRSFKLWLDEANAKLIPSLYREYNYSSKNNYEDFNNMKVMYKNIFYNMRVSGNILSIDDVNQLMMKGEAWDEKESRSKEGVAYDYAIVLWNYVYNQCNDLDTFKYYLRNMSIGQDDSLKTLELLLGKDIKTIESDFLGYYTQY